MESSSLCAQFLIPLFYSIFNGSYGDSLSFTSQILVSFRATAFISSKLRYPLAECTDKLYRERFLLLINFLKLQVMTTHLYCLNLFLNSKYVNVTFFFFLIDHITQNRQLRYSKKSMMTQILKLM